MTGQLIKNTVGGRIYPGNWILHENKPYEVTKVNEKSVLISDSGNTIRVSKEDIQDQILKYTVQIDKKFFDLSYSDYSLAVTSDSIVNGYTVQVKTKAHIGETVRIDCLSTADQHDLLNPNDRFGVIINKHNNFYDVELNKTKRTIRLHRTRFVLVNEKDSKIFFKLICQYCLR